MPTIGRFYGITIQMFFKEHGVPHFHARDGGQVAVSTVEGVERIRGELPPRAERPVREWADLAAGRADAKPEHARAGEPLTPIEPLA
jgi:Domain of unknown function (DUF4160)